MKLKEVQQAILNNPDSKEISFLLAFYRNELVTNDSIDFRTVDELFHWAIEQTPAKIGLYASLSLLRGFYDFRGFSPLWEPLRDAFDAHLEAIDHKDRNRIMAGLRGELQANEFRTN